MIKRTIIFLIIFLTGHCLFATAQIPDILIFNGEKYNLTVNPMESFFREFPEKRPNSRSGSTALWRGYIATFEIIQNELWVTDIVVLDYKYENGKYTEGYISVINECLDGKDRLKVDWYNGLLVLPQGKIIEYVHMGYASTYEHYKLLEIHNGNFIRELDMNYEEYSEFKARQFEFYKQTDEYKKILKEAMSDGKYSEEWTEEFLRIYIIEYLEKIYE